MFPRVTILLFWYAAWDCPMDIWLSKSAVNFLNEHPISVPIWLVAKMADLWSFETRRIFWCFFAEYILYVPMLLWPPHVKSWLIGKDWCWEGLEAGGEGDDRGWDGWMASLTRWTWVWVDSRSWWWTGKPGVLQFTRLQSVGHDWATELNWTAYLHIAYICTNSSRYYGSCN